MNNKYKLIFNKGIKPRINQIKKENNRYILNIDIDYIRLNASNVKIIKVLDDVTPIISYPGIFFDESDNVSDITYNVNQNHPILSPSEIFDS